MLPAFGLLLLGYLIGRLGPGAIWHSLIDLRWRFALVLAIACGWHISNTIAWACAFPPDAFRPRLRHLFMAKLAGEAVSQVTPLANLGGEPLKAYLLRGESPTSRGLASVVINKMAQVITGVLFTSVGLALVVFQWPLPQDIPITVQTGLWALLGCALLLLLFVWRQQGQLFSSLLRVLCHLGLRPEDLEQRQARASRIDRSIAGFYQRHWLRFGLVMFFHAIGWLLGAVETLVILEGLGADVTFTVAFLVTALSVIINGVFFLMPSNIGVMEGGQVFLLTTLGLDPAMGLAMGIVKRMRKVFWITVGWLFLHRLGHTALTASTAAEAAAAYPAVQTREAPPAAGQR